MGGRERVGVDGPLIVAGDFEVVQFDVRPNGVGAEDGGALWQAVHGDGEDGADAPWHFVARPFEADLGGVVAAVAQVAPEGGVGERLDPLGPGPVEKGLLAVGEQRDGRALSGSDETQRPWSVGQERKGGNEGGNEGDGAGVDGSSHG